MQADDDAQAGFFGKLPATGDFVARGLSDRFRKAWDGWVTRHLAPRLKAGAVWPDTGLRFRLTSGGRAAAGVVIPAQDSAGRAFPLSVVLTGAALPDPAGLSPWIDAAHAIALRAVADAMTPDDLWAALDDLPEPSATAGGAAFPPFLLWTTGAPVACDPDEPVAALDALLPSLG